MTTRGPGDPGTPVDLRAWRPERPPDEAWPCAALTTLGWHLVLAGGLFWLALVPLADPPLAPGEAPPTGLAGYGYGWGVLLLRLLGPILAISLVVSLAICRRLGRDAPASRETGIWRGTWVTLLALPCGSVIRVLALVVGSAQQRR